MSRLLGNGKEGLLFILSAPAGTGKTTLAQMLCEEFDCVKESVSCTTRPPRLGEIEGEHYFFLSSQEFERRVSKGDFLEHANVFDFQYGTLKSTVADERRKGRHVVLVIDTQGALQLKGKVSGVFIFVTPPSLEELRERLLKRKTESLEVIEKRLEWARHEIEMVSHYDYHIVNDNLMVAYEVLRSIFIAEEHKLR